MARRERVTISLFPFMSVLACTIGALTLLLVAMSLSAVGTSSASQAAYAQSRAEREAQRKRLYEEREAVERAEEIWREVDRELAARGLQAGLTAESIDAVLERIGEHDRIARSLREVEEAMRALDTDRDRIETTIEVLESRRETLPILIDPTGLSRHLSPWFIECDAGGVTAYRASDGLQYFVPAEAISATGDFARYLMRIRAMPNALVVLLVRPDGLATSKLASRVIRQAGIRVARLPLPGQGELDWSLLRRAEGAG